MKIRFRRTATILTATIALGVLAQSPAFSIDYVITDLGTLGGTQSHAYGINNLDEVVGLAYLPGDLVWHAFLYKGGMMTDLGSANCIDPYGKSVARRINDSGQIAGTSCFWVPGNFDRAFLYSGGVMKDLGTLGGGGSFGWDINNWGHVVGGAATPGDATTHAFLYKDGVMNDLGTIAGGTCCSIAYAINDYGQIVGQSRYSPSTDTHAFLFSGGQMTDITPALVTMASAYDINNLGQIVGEAYFPGTDRHAFLYSQGVLTDLGSFGGGPARSEAWSINNYGQIVGWSYVPGPIPHAFLYENGVMIDLNTLLPAGSGWVLNYALDINDKGRIVGTGTINGQSHAFLMVPQIPEIKLTPASLNFGIVTVGASLTKEAKIENSGTADLTVTNITRCTGTSTEFSWSPILLPFTVSPGNGVSLSVTYTPANEGTDSGCLEITSNDPYRPVVILTFAVIGVLPFGLGVSRDGVWYLDANGNGTWDGCETDFCWTFGLPTDTSIVGDWNGDGKTEIGIFRNGLWALDLNGNNSWDGPLTDVLFTFGQAGDIPVTGDWDGTGTTKIGIFRNGLWALDLNGNNFWDGPLTDALFIFGQAGDIPVAGDCDGTGTTKVGIFRDGLWALDLNGNNFWDGLPTDAFFTFGQAGDHPVVGLW